MNVTTQICVLLLATTLSSTSNAQSPAMRFWNSYDARAEPLNVDVVKQWDDDIGRYELVRFDLGKLTGTNKTASPIMAAYFGYPKTASARATVPGIVHIHGGGQLAQKQRVADWVKLGFACVSINWGAKVLEDANTPNTDWDGLAAGFVRPGIGPEDELTHHNLVRPDRNTLFKTPHLLNSSWNLIALSARRALTFLEQRPEVDASRLGVEGHSMGGRSTVLTAIDPRVKAAAPSVGGSGFLYQDMWGLPGSARRMTQADGLELYTQVVSAQSYWPHIKAPILFLQATNDFNAPTEWVVNGMSLLPRSTRRGLAMAPHLNHRFTTETAAARMLWMEAHLKGSFKFPKQSSSKLVLNTKDHVPMFEVRVDQSTGLPVEKVEVYYGYARDPRVRFWRSAEVRRSRDRYTARCPVFDTAEPLFAFANITYRLPKTLPARPGAAATRLLTVSSQYQSVYPEELQAARAVATEKQQRTIDDFSRGWQDWYRLNYENPHHWFYSTRKVIDPSWTGPKGASLAVDVITSAPNNLIAVGIEANTWQSYTGRKRDTFHALVELPKSGRNSISLTPRDFRNRAGQPMADWDEATELTLTPAKRVSSSVAVDWQGGPAELQNLRWRGGTTGRRLYPHQVRGSGEAKSVAFDDEFQKAIDGSVKLEKIDAESGDGARLYLTRERASSVKSFWRVLNNQGVSGKPITIGDKTYKHGLGVHADSEIMFALSGRFTSFHTIPAPDSAHRGTLEMKILVDGKRVFSTGRINSYDGAERKPVDIDIAGAKTLTLIVDSLDDRGGDHAIWADAYLTKNPAGKKTSAGAKPVDGMRLPSTDSSFKPTSSRSPRLDVFPRSTFRNAAEPAGTATISATFTRTGSVWDRRIDESKVFKYELASKQAADSSYQLRMGRGGQLYSLRGAFGESVPPSWREARDDLSPWNDEVWQFVAICLRYNGIQAIQGAGDLPQATVEKMRKSPYKTTFFVHNSG
jgi:dienelactone hydrolase